MPNLTDGWHLDRAPRLTGYGATTVPPTHCALIEAKSPVPIGTQCVFENAVGFDSNTWLTGIPAGTDGNEWSFSCWVNFSTDKTPGFVPDPMKTGAIFTAVGTPAGAYSDVSIFPNTGLTAGVTLDGGGASVTVSSNDDQGVTWPPVSDAMRGWAHLMASMRIKSVVFDGIFYQTTIEYLAYVNDFEILNTTATATNTVNQPLFKFSDTTSTYVGMDATSVPAAGRGMYGALAELWEMPNMFVDWGDTHNRYLFHQSAVQNWATVYAPVDIGAKGERPFNLAPRLYLSGPPSLFVKNRADGGATTLTVNGDALVLINDSPTF